MLENLQRHKCDCCTYIPFTYYRHKRSHDIVTLNPKVGVRSDIVDKFEPIEQIMQSCPRIRFFMPKNEVYVNIMPGDVCSIDPAYIGGIYKVQELPISRYMIEGQLGNKLWRQHRLCSTPGSSFSMEFKNSLMDTVISRPKFTNSVIFTTSACNYDWSMLMYDGASTETLFSKIKKVHLPEISTSLEETSLSSQQPTIIS